METTEFQEGYFEKVSYDSLTKQLHVKLASGYYAIYYEVDEFSYVGFLSSDDKEDYFKEVIAEKHEKHVANE